MFISGTALTGEPDHVHLKSAPYLGPATTAKAYRLYSVRDEFPGLVPVLNDGFQITGELYELSEEIWLDSLQPHEPSELELGFVVLEDGTEVNGMLLELSRATAAELHDISDFSGWRNYRAGLTGNGQNSHDPT